jgi:hypothetical protein
VIGKRERIGEKQIQVELLRKKYARCLFTTLKIHGTITAFPCSASQVEDVLLAKERLMGNRKEAKWLRRLNQIFLVNFLSQPVEYPSLIYHSKHRQCDVYFYDRGNRCMKSINFHSVFCFHAANNVLQIKVYCFIIIIIARLMIIGIEPESEMIVTLFKTPALNMEPMS